MAERPVEPAPIIAPEDDIEDIFEAEDIRYTDGTTLEGRSEETTEGRLPGPRLRDLPKYDPDSPTFISPRRRSKTSTPASHDPRTTSSLRSTPPTK